jgi:DNA-binding IclR family transcriptional regulator
MRKQLSQDENKASVGTLARGLDILELFAGESPELTQTEISDRLGLPVPTVHRLVKLLTERGWLARDPATRRLRLGLGAARLLPAVRLPGLAREPLRMLAERTGETANLATLDGTEVLYLLSETGSHLLTLRSHVGLRLPVHATALGKCLLAQLDDDAARAAAGAEPYEALTDRTVTRWGKLRANLERIRREGVAFSREEYEIGLCSVAVPLDWVQGDGPVAVNVSLPASRAGREATAGLVRELRTAVTAITGGGGAGGRGRGAAGGRGQDAAGQRGRGPAGRTGAAA